MNNDSSSQSQRAASSTADRSQVTVDLGARTYDIEIATDGWANLPHWLKKWTERFPHWKTDHPQGVVVTDSNVGKLYGEKLLPPLREAGWKLEKVTVPAGEGAKSAEQVSVIYDALVDMKADRKTVVIALGGGVVGDLSGFAAATYGRGIPFVQCPTTLLADVDSSVGGKVGINHPRGKNLIGAFHQPMGVYIDTTCMTSLPDRDYRSGLAEVVKYGVIMDANFFEELENNVAALNERNADVLRNVIAKCCRLKADVVEQDEMERSGLRAILNYGHTFAHAYEALSGYGELMHGEAVSIGMMDAAILSEKLGRVDQAFVGRQRQLLDSLHLPTRLPQELAKPAEDYIACMRLDKKSVAGQLRFILPTRLGHVETVADVPEELVTETLQEGQS